MNRRAAASNGLQNRVRALFALALAGLLCACAGSPGRLDLAAIPPLQVDDRVYQSYEVQHLVTTPDLLAMDSEMREFVERYAGPNGSQRQQLMNLHRSVPRRKASRPVPSAKGS